MPVTRAVLAAPRTKVAAPAVCAASLKRGRGVAGAVLMARLADARRADARVVPASAINQRDTRVVGVLMLGLREEFDEEK